jgi:hypothetical protein
MTQDEIIEMAKQAGYSVDTFGFGIWDSAEFNRFAKLVAEHERKECEKIIWNADAWIGSDAKIWIVKSIQEARRKA